MAIVRMHYPERRIAVLQTFRDDAHRAHVKQFIEGQMLFLHLSPDAVDVFRAPIDFRLYALFFHGLTQMRNKLVDVMLAIDTPLMEQFSDAFIFIRMQITEAEILKLPFKLTNAEAVSQRRIDVGTFFRRQYALIFRCVFHFSQMCDALGELYDDAAEIINHRQQHATDIIYLIGGDGIVMGGF